jgi:hypothetical protein
MHQLAASLVGLALSSAVGAGVEPVWFCTQCRDAHEVSVLPRLDELASCDFVVTDSFVLRSDGCPVSGRLP